MFRKIIVFTPTPLLAAVVVKPSTDNKISTADREELDRFVCKPSDLPIYTPLHATKTLKREIHPAKISTTREALECGIRVMRTEVQSGVNVVSEQKKVIDNYIDTGVAHTQATIDTLRQPNNTMHRAGAIAVGGLTGFIFAIRGGFIKKVLYTATGAGAIASLCYPQQAEEYAKEALLSSRKGFAIAYNFVKGVKPGDEPIPVEPINKFPTSVQDVKFLLWDLYDETKDAIFSKKK